jgi:hypothetical protein
VKAREAENHSSLANPLTIGVTETPWHACHQQLLCLCFAVQSLLKQRQKQKFFDDIVGRSRVCTGEGPALGRLIAPF